MDYLVNQVLGELEDCALYLQTHFGVLRSLWVKVHPIQVAKALCCLSWIHVITDELSNLLQSIARLNAFGYEEVEKVGVIYILGALTCKDFRLFMLVEIIQLVFQQVDLVLTWHDVLAFLCFFFSLRVHRREVVVNNVEYAWLRGLLGVLQLSIHSGGTFRLRAENLGLTLFHISLQRAVLVWCNIYWEILVWLRLIDYLGD